MDEVAVVLLDGSRLRTVLWELTSQSLPCLGLGQGSAIYLFNGSRRDMRSLRTK